MRTRGFTLVELAAICALLGVAGAIAIQPRADDKLKAFIASQERALEQRINDTKQLRDIHQAMISFGNLNKDTYPRPSEFDKANDTVAGDAAAKDTTANIMSILVYHGFLKSCDPLVSPLENNTSIVAKQDYALTNPKAAVKPERALWDPSLSADFIAGTKGNISYAHAMPFGGRFSSVWMVTFDMNFAVLSNRGPQIKSVAYSEDNKRATLELALPTSNTLKLLDASKPRKVGEAIAWRGHMVSQDDSVHFIESKIGDKQVLTARDVRTYKAADGTTRPDTTFYDEPDDAASKNTMLGVFTKAGAKREDWTAIWD